MFKLDDKVFTKDGKLGVIGAVYYNDKCLDPSSYYVEFENGNGPNFWKADQLRIVMMFDRGDRVSTPDGFGTVQYRRMLPPNYSDVEVYSVRLDRKAEGSSSYTGTIYKAADVRAYQ